MSLSLNHRHAGFWSLLVLLVLLLMVAAPQASAQQSLSSSYLMSEAYCNLNDGMVGRCANNPLPVPMTDASTVTARRFGNGGPIYIVFYVAACPPPPVPQPGAPTEWMSVKFTADGRFVHTCGARDPYYVASPRPDPQPENWRSEMRRAIEHVKWSVLRVTGCYYDGAWRSFYAGGKRCRPSRQPNSLRMTSSGTMMKWYSCWPASGNNPRWLKLVDPINPAGTPLGAMAQRVVEITTCSPREVRSRRLAPLIAVAPPVG